MSSPISSGSSTPLPEQNKSILNLISKFLNKVHTAKKDSSREWEDDRRYLCTSRTKWEADLKSRQPFILATTFQISLIKPGTVVAKQITNICVSYCIEKEYTEKQRKNKCNCSGPPAFKSQKCMVGYLSN